jgi:hypothetical protein
MDVRIVGVPVVDRQPVEPRPEIPFGIGHQLSGEGSQIGHFASVLRRDDEPEMVAIVLASFCERAPIGAV